MIKTGDNVKMNDNYMVSEKNKNKIFTVSSAPQTICGTLVVWIDDYKGCYAVDGLDLVRNSRRRAKENI